jgi:predicted methyltransferase
MGHKRVRAEAVALVLWSLAAIAAGAASGPATPADSAPGAHARGAHAGDAEDALARHAETATPHSRFEDIEQWLRVWDDPEVEAWSEPESVVAALRMRPGMRLAFLGAGNGYFDARLARAVGPAGVVYALDPDAGLVRHAEERARREATPNVRPLQAAGATLPLPAAGVDRILLVDAVHHLSGRRAYFERLRTLLAPGGLLVVVEWRPGELARGPAAGFKVAPETVIEELRAAGYRLVERTALRYHDVLVFRSAAPERRP